MHVVLTQQDLERLSPSTREELQALLFGPVSDGEEFATDECPPDFEYAKSDETGNGLWDRSFPTAEAKVVVETDVEQTRKLVANLSPKSIETLKRFADGGSVSLDSLIGEGNPYETFNDLKRSFVGAVNRRLRTVTKIRTAVLFRKSASPEEEGISVKDLTAQSLRAVFVEAEVV
ncbi:MAG: hypothetical protein U1C04_24355 [Hydrogenophaga sp.]|uniref:hypothetical protein n=1 Tax=Hydrogenophaga sp. TaxID=1904254 RepID=UPI002AB8833D|nr:hypothetical protein [Hydrogenophaga sp.]MDZ4283879.1 hypothetical protein [Hydrogenophaga sp.]